MVLARGALDSFRCFATSVPSAVTAAAVTEPFKGSMRRSFVFTLSTLWNPMIINWFY